MRLINTRTHLLDEFFGDNIPEYAILSHTWGDEEVTYQEWIYLHNQGVARWGWTPAREELDAIKRKAGYSKIVSACKIASGHRLDWLWADTNCIDKTSSAELSEAINSMFQWYKHSSVCYAYLADVPKETVILPDSRFRRSRWFTRGWTLQELLAPNLLQFYSMDWHLLANSNDTSGGTISTLSLLQDITGINKACFLPIKRGRPPLSSFHAAVRMSWAAKRTTTRLEDMAYSLMGIFDIHMPLLYGEGTRAFARLQEELIGKDADDSIFAWKSSTMQLARRWPDTDWAVPPEALAALSRTTIGRSSGVLASDIQDFADSCGQPWDNSSMIHMESRMCIEEPYTISNLGLSMEIRLIETMCPHLYFGVLKCSAGASQEVWMPLRRASDAENCRHYIRSTFPSSTVCFRFESWLSDPRAPITLRQHLPGPQRPTKTFIRLAAPVAQTPFFEQLGYHDAMVPILVRKPRSSPPFDALYVLEAGTRVLFAFPLGRGHYRPRGDFGMPLAHPLYLAEDIGISHCIISFSSTDSRDERVGVFLAAQANTRLGGSRSGGNSLYGPSRWTCRSIIIPAEPTLHDLSTTLARSLVCDADWKHSDLGPTGHYVAIGDNAYHNVFDNTFDDNGWPICTYTLVASVLFANRHSQHG